MGYLCKMIWGSFFFFGERLVVGLQWSREFLLLWFYFRIEEKKKKRFCRLGAQGKPEMVAAVIHIKWSGGVL